MAIKINAFDANNDGTGIDVTAYFLDFDTNYAGTFPGGWFSDSPSDMSGNQFASTEQPNLIADETKQSVVFESGGGGNSIDYSLATHVVGGDLDAISFGHGLSYQSGTDTFPLAKLDLRISGIGLVNQTGAGNAVDEFLLNLMTADTAHLLDYLDNNEIEFAGSSGADKFTGFSKDDKIVGGAGDDELSGGGGNDTLYGGAGNDTLDGGAGNDTIVYDGRGNDVIATGFVAGVTSEDVIRISKGFTDYASLIAATANVGSDAVIDFGGGNTLKITGVTKESLHEDDFTFGLFDDGMSPLVSDDTAATVKDIATVVDVLANDKDADSGTLDPATVTVVDGPDHGTFSINTTTGKITYTPTVGYSGSDSFTYTVKDNDGNISGEATVTIDVAAGHTLTSGDDVFSGDSQGLKFSGIEVHGGAGHDYIVTSNQASHPDKIYGDDGNDVIFTGGGNDYVDGGAGDDVIHGRAGNDTLIGGEGSDTFVVRMTDTGTTTITDNDGVLFHGTFRPATYPASWVPAPGATNGFAIGGTATLVGPGVFNLAVTDNTSTLRNFTLSWTGGDLTITEAGKSQTVVIEDYDNGTFGIMLPAPDVSDDTASTVKDIATVVDVLANDKDSDGTLDPATVTVVDGPDHGTFSVNTTTGKITYTPTVGYSGADSITYTVKDNDGNISGEATVTIDVAAGHTLTSGDDVFSGDSQGLKFSGIEVHGGAGHDYIVTSNQAAHPDKIYGDDGNDVIFTGGGNDYVDGGAGDDVIHGRAGNDTLIGGTGNDTFVVRFTDNGTTTITDNDGVLFHGTFRPATYPASWVPAPGATNGYAINGYAAYVSPGTWNLTVPTNLAAPNDFVTLTLSWAGGDLTITRAGNPQTVVIEDYVNGTFGISLEVASTINGTSKADTIDGNYTTKATNLGDTINGLAGDDTINALGGDDKINGGAGKDTINGGDGNDIIYVSNGEGQSDIINGGNDTDTLQAIGIKAITLGGFDGGNSIEQIVGNNLQINGTSGNDTFDLRNVTSITDVTYFDGAAGNDTFWTPDGVDGEYRGGAGNDTFNGGDGNDTFQGDAGVDVLNGGDGDDTLVIFGTNDTNDTLNGGNGTDTVKVAGTAAVTLAGFYSVANSIEVWSGNGKELLGTSGDNIFDFGDITNATGLPFVNGAAGKDVIGGSNTVSLDLRGDAGDDVVYAGAVAATLTGGAGKDVVTGGAGDDTIIISGTNDITDTLNGGGGTDTIKVAGTTAVTLAEFRATAQSIEVWEGNSKELLGTKAADTFDFSGLTGATGLPFVNGLAGNDVITGSNTVSLELRGDAGDDTLNAGTAGATLVGGAGKDTLNGGAGNDTLVISGTLDTTDVLNGNGGTDTIRVDGKTAVTLAALDTVASSIEIWAGNGKELLGTKANDTFDLGALTTVTGLPFVNGLAGNDTIIGSDFVSLELRGDAGDDTLNAGNAGAILNGGVGNDTLNGGIGDDTFIGGAGADIMTGGGGSDTVSYATSATAVVVNLRTGFASGGDATGDKLSGISNVIGSKGNDTITAASGGGTLNGGAGIDTLLGGIGDDTFIISGTNDVNDIRDGNDGNDTIQIAGGNATLAGFVGAYEDVEAFDGGGFALLGTTAANYFDFTGVTVTNLLAVDGGAGNDTIIGSDVSGMRLIGGAGVDTVTGGAQDDTIVISGTNDTTDVINGGGGTNTIEVIGKSAVTLAGFNATTLNIDEWSGNNQALLGTATANVFDLSGLTNVTGLTFIDGGAGNDTIIGSDAWAGDLRGGAGNDTLTGGALSDTLTGGAGADTFVFYAGGGTDTVTDLTFASKTAHNATLDDKIDLTDFSFAGYNDVQALMTQVGNHVVIDFGGGDTLQLNNVTIATLNTHAADFLL